MLPHSRTPAAAARLAVAAAATSLPLAAHASFLPPELMDTAATYLAWFILVVIPIAGIALFWLVHVLPEKIAHKRHHPQRDAIQTLCLLSLVFGGLLWPIAWLWAYTKPVGHQMAYGTDKHEDYFHEMDEKLNSGELPQEELDHLREQLDSIASRRALPPRLKALRDALASLGEQNAPAAGGRA
jgi:CBS domain containing-hemolysin-like protein